MNIDLKTAMKQFEKRKKKNSKEAKIDNSSLYAGSPMYFYCKFCDAQTDVLPECYIGKPKQICTPCEVLHIHGLI